MSKAKNRSIYSQDYITMDLETRNLNGTLEPICVSLFTGYKLMSFYLSDYESSTHLLEASIKYLMHRKYKTLQSVPH